MPSAEHEPASSLTTLRERLMARAAEPFNRLDFSWNRHLTRRLLERGPLGRPLYVLADRTLDSWSERSTVRAGERERLEQASSVRRLVARAGEILFANQKKGEILPFLELLRRTAPRAVLEIGVAGGGTNLLLSRAHPDVTFVAAIDLYVKNKRKLSYFAPRDQERLFLDASSHAPETVEAVQRALGDRKLDVVFIDGDHSYDGAKRDFEAYAPLVREGGIIALHDIVPDELTRTGLFTGNWVGEVPILWNDLKRSYPDWREFVADPQQDGYGIGVIRFDSAITPIFRG